MGKEKLQRLVVFTSLLFLLAVPSHGQDSETPSPLISEASIFVESAFADLFSDAQVDGYEQLEAAVSVDEKKAKVSYAPFLLKGSYNLLSETRLELSQSDDKTSVGILLRWNPRSPRSTHGGKLYKNYSKDLPILLDAEYIAVRKSIIELEKTERQANAGQTPEITKLWDEITSGVSTTRGDACGNVEGEIKEKCKKLAKLEAAAVLKRIGIDNERDEYIRNQVELDFLQGQLKQKAGRFEKAGSIMLADYYSQLLSSKMPIVGLSYKTEFFSVLDSDPVDADADGLNDRGHRLAGRRIALTADWKPTPKAQLSGLLGYHWIRPSSEDGSEIGEARNWGLTYGYMARTLNKKFKKSEDFIKSGFIPSIVVGISLEQSTCASSKPKCVEGIDKVSSATPFIDFKVRKSAQFRLGFPFKRIENILGQDTEDIGVVTQIAFQFSNLK